MCLDFEKNTKTPKCLDISELSVYIGLMQRN